MSLEVQTDTSNALYINSIITEKKATNPVDGP